MQTLARAWSGSTGAAQRVCGCSLKVAVARMSCCIPLLYGTTATIWSLGCVTHLRYLPIPPLTCRNAASWYAVDGSVERPCAAKMRPG